MNTEKISHKKQLIEKLERLPESDIQEILRRIEKETGYFLKMSDVQGGKSLR